MYDKPIIRMRPCGHAMVQAVSCCLSWHGLLFLATHISCLPFLPILS